MKKIIIGLLVMAILTGAVFSCSGWRYDENGRSYYNVYDDDGNIIETVYMDENITNTTNTTPSTTKNTTTKKTIHLDTYKTT